MSKQNSFYRRQTRGVLLYNLYLAWDNGLNDPAQPKTMNGQALEMALRYRATLPPKEDLIRALQWLADCGYVEVDWEMDDQTSYDSVTITQKGIRLCEDKKAAQTEADVLLPAAPVNQMPWEEMRRLDEKLTGLRVAVEGMRKDVSYLSQFYVPLTLLGLVALFVGVISLFVAMDNRALMLEQQQQVVQEIQQLPEEVK